MYVRENKGCKYCSFVRSPHTCTGSWMCSHPKFTHETVSPIHGIVFKEANILNEGLNKKLECPVYTPNI